jgi:hypothetical protein
LTSRSRSLEVEVEVAGPQSEDHAEHPQSLEPVFLRGVEDGLDRGDGECRGWALRADRRAREAQPAIYVLGPARVSTPSRARLSRPEQAVGGITLGRVTTRQDRSNRIWHKRPAIMGAGTLGWTRGGR